MTSVIFKITVTDVQPYRSNGGLADGDDDSKTYLMNL